MSAVVNSDVHAVSIKQRPIEEFRPLSCNIILLGPRTNDVCLSKEGRRFCIVGSSACHLRSHRWDGLIDARRGQMVLRHRGTSDRQIPCMNTRMNQPARNGHPKNTEKFGSQRVVDSGAVAGTPAMEIKQVAPRIGGVPNRQTRCETNFSALTRATSRKRPLSFPPYKSLSHHLHPTTQMRMRSIGRRLRVTSVA